MGTPADTRAQRVSTTLTFTNVAAAESARQAIVFQDATAPDAGWSLDGWNLERDGGTAGSVVSTLRFYTISAAGSMFHMNTATLAANDEAAGEYGIGKSMDLADFVAPYVSIENDTGTDQDYKLTVWLRSRRVV